MESLLKRGENLDDLVGQSEELSLQARTFYTTVRVFYDAFSVVDSVLVVKNLVTFSICFLFSLL